MYSNRSESRYCYQTYQENEDIFEPHNITFTNKEIVWELNGCTIEAYPSNHLDAYRALDNRKFILLDEADFFRKSQQEDVRHVSERYIAKSDPYIVMVSTLMHLVVFSKR